MKLIRVMLMSASVAASSVACTTIQAAGQFRNPEFKDAQAPAPTVTTEVVPCLSTATPTGSGARMTNRLKGLVHAQLKKTLAPLPEFASSIVCAGLATDEKFYKDLVFGADWKTGEELHNLVKEVAAANKAKSVLIPVVRSETSCVRDTATVRDRSGATVGTVDYGTQTCKEADAEMGVFLIDPAGGILYKSTTRGTSETFVAKLLKDIPATFADASVAESAPALFAAAPSAAAAPAAATKPKPVIAVYAPPTPSPEQQRQTDKQMDAMVAELGSVPEECKRYARLVCRQYQSMGEQGLQFCKAQVDAVRQIAQTPEGKSSCANMLEQYAGAGLK